MQRPGAAAASLDHGWIRHGRARLNLAMRLAARAHGLLSVGGAAKGPARTAVALASAAADVAVAQRLRRSDRAELVVHGIVDAVDLTVWTALSTRPGPAQLSTAMTTSHPLAIEAGARHRWGGLAVPLVGAALTAGVERRRGRPRHAEAFVWQVAAALGGAGLARYAGGLRARRIAAHEVELEPQLARAELAASNEVALGLDNLADEVQRAGVLIRLGTGAGPVDGAGPWKAALAEQTRRSHRYLVDVLLGWQRGHNQATDLSAVVAFDLAPELAPVILDAAAAAALAERLDGLGLRGRIAVAGEGGSVSSSGAPTGSGGRSLDDPTITIRVGDHRLAIDTGVAPVRLHVDPLPGGFAWTALWLAAAAPQDGVPLPAALGPAAAGLGLMGWAHLAGRDRPAPTVPAVLGSSALVVVASVLQTATVRTARADPVIPRIPASLALRGHAFVTALARPGLPRPVLAVAWATGALALGLAWTLTPRPRPVREFLAELSWVAMSATMARAFTDGIARDSDDLEAWVEADDRRRLAAAAADGRHAAVRQVRSALTEAAALEAEHGADLDPEVRAEARRRIERCGERLARFEAGPDRPVPAA